MNELVSAYNNIPSDLSQLNEEQLRSILMAVKIDEYKEQMKAHLNEAKFDLPNVIAQWLKGKSPQTARMYNLYLNDFIEYLNGKSVLSVSSFDVDVYIDDVLSTFSNGKAKLTLSILSAFYSSLERWGFISKNPWKKAKLKGINTPSKKVVPTEEDVERMLRVYSGDSLADKKMFLAIKLMSVYGMRVGFFNENMKLEGNILSSISKGKHYAVKVGDWVLDDKNLLFQLRSNSIQSNWGRKIRGFEVHSLRHHFAIKEYMKEKDIYRVSRLLHHTSVQVTQKYLRGMEVEV